ncbi:MAG: transcriptional regulator [Terracidiphilus sp.]|nr:transcriptional regulator [Terracidiphilus sp.]MDR3776953.1 transcriptional regulator [Terracidiphilus sp.]
MGLTREFKDVVQARYQSDAKFRRMMLAGAIRSLLSGEGAVEKGSSSGRAEGGTGPGYWQAAEGRTILRDFINATLGFPALAEKTGIHVKTLHQMFGPKGNPTAAHLFHVIACLQEEEGVRLRVVG